MVQTVNTDGYQFVTLHSGKRNRVFPVGRVIHNAFCGEPPEKEYPIRHKDGVTWNNWQSNVEWEAEMDNLHWYVASNYGMRHNKMKAGPFERKVEAVKAMKDGEILIGKHKQLGYVEIMEILAGGAVTSWPENPLDLAAYCEAQADMHDKFFWALTMKRMAIVVRTLCTEAWEDIAKHTPLGPSAKIGRTPVVAAPPPATYDGSVDVVMPEQPVRRQLTMQPRPAPTTPTIAPRRFIPRPVNTNR